MKYSVAFVLIAVVVVLTSASSGCRSVGAARVGAELPNPAFDVDCRRVTVTSARYKYLVLYAKEESADGPPAPPARVYEAAGNPLTFDLAGPSTTLDGTPVMEPADLSVLKYFNFRDADDVWSPVYVGNPVRQKVRATRSQARDGGGACYELPPSE